VSRARVDEPGREVGHEGPHVLLGEREVPRHAVVLVGPVRRAVGRGVVLEGVDLHAARRVLVLHHLAEPVQDLLAGLLPGHEVPRVRDLARAHLEVPDVVVRAGAVLHELPGQVEVGLPQEVEGEDVGVEAEGPHLAAIQRVLVLGPLDALPHPSPDHRVGARPEDLPLPLLVDVHLGVRVLLHSSSTAISRSRKERPSFLRSAFFIAITRFTKFFFAVFTIALMIAPLTMSIRFTVLIASFASASSFTLTHLFSPYSSSMTYLRSAPTAACWPPVYPSTRARKAR